MMPPSDWRSPAAYSYLSDVDPSGLAWEFLRRNPDYRREYRAIGARPENDDLVQVFAGRWGMRFYVDPLLKANEAPLIWLPHVDPAVVIIAPAPEAFEAARCIDPASVTLERVVDDGRYLLIDDGPTRMRIVLVAEATRTTPAAALIPLDDEFDVRLQAARRLWQCLNGPPRRRALDWLTPRQRVRGILALRALDARLANEPYRSIAQGLFGEARVPSGTGWKSHDLRDRTIRLVRSGLDLMRGAYRYLLRPTPRRRG
jgi:hypothetical protein